MTGKSMWCKKNKKNLSELFLRGFSVPGAGVWNSGVHHDVGAEYSRKALARYRDIDQDIKKNALSVFE